MHPTNSSVRFSFHDGPDVIHQRCNELAAVIHQILASCFDDIEPVVTVYVIVFVFTILPFHEIMVKDRH